mmetsp:Transcript_93295/g.301797  ORF Transcript_93295/g.301797 Transcript_93295/m.301797 type:complete len:213 (-) Transcript_93295:343-981(-)
MLPEAGDTERTTGGPQRSCDGQTGHGVYSTLRGSHSRAVAFQKQSPLDVAQEQAAFCARQIGSGSLAHLFCIAQKTQGTSVKDLGSRASAHLNSSPTPLGSHRQPAMAAHMQPLSALAQRTILELPLTTSAVAKASVWLFGGSGMNKGLRTADVMTVGSFGTISQDVVSMKAVLGSCFTCQARNSWKPPDLAAVATFSLISCTFTPMPWGKM